MSPAAALVRRCAAVSYTHLSYLLTNQNLRFTNINWTFFIAAGALTVVCLIVYIAVKKRYWFW